MINNRTVLAMEQKTLHIWIWIYNDRMYKAVSCPAEGTITIFDDADHILIKRTGLSPSQIKKIEFVLETAGKQHINGQGPYNLL